jgi:hypothetical protein
LNIYCSAFSVFIFTYLVHSVDKLLVFNIYIYSLRFIRFFSLLLLSFSTHYLYLPCI